MVQAILVTRTGATDTAEDGGSSQEEVDEVVPPTDLEALAILEPQEDQEEAEHQEASEEDQAAAAEVDQVTLRVLALDHRLASSLHHNETPLSKRS